MGKWQKYSLKRTDLPISQTSFFSDVLKSNGFHDYISTLAVERITGGYEDGTYKPGNTVSREHFAVFVARMLDDKFKPTSDYGDASFILDKTKVYTWEYYDNGEVFRSTSSYSKMEYEGVSGWDLWRETVGDDAGYFAVKENDSGLYELTCTDLGIVYCELKEEGPYISLEYPLLIGGKWGSLQNVYDPVIYTVISTNRIVNTKAGTFKKVVEVMDSDGWVYYYAPNVGLVKAVENGITFAELVKLEVNR